MRNLVDSIQTRVLADEPMETSIAEYTFELEEAAHSYASLPKAQRVRHSVTFQMIDVAPEDQITNSKVRFIQHLRQELYGEIELKLQRLRHEIVSGCYPRKQRAMIDDLLDTVTGMMK